MGVATPDTNPGTPDTKQFYLAWEDGTYTYFNNISVGYGDVVLFMGTDNEWSAKYINGIFDPIKKSIARQELTYPAQAQIGVAPGSGAINDNGALLIPAGSSGYGSNVGVNTYSVNAIISSEDINDCSVYGLFKIEGLASDFSSHLNPIVIEFWSTGNVSNRLKASMVQIDNETYLVSGYIMDVDIYKTSDNSIFGGLWVGFSLELTQDAVSQNLRITPLSASHLSIKLKDYMSQQFGDMLLALKTMGNDKFFMPIVSRAYYLNHVLAATGDIEDAVSIYMNGAGNLEVVCASGKDPYGFIIGMHCNFEANKTYRMRLLLSANNIYVSKFTPYLIYHNSSGRFVDRNINISVSGTTIILEKYFTVTLDAFVSLFGMQYTSHDAYPNGARISVEDIQIIEQNNNDVSDLSNAFSSILQKWHDNLTYLIGLQNDATNWRNDLYGDCVAREGGNGFTCPTGGNIVFSNTRLLMSEHKRGYPLYMRIYFRCSEILPGLNLFFLEGSRQVRLPFFQDTSDPEITDRYFANIEYTASDSIDWALQQTAYFKPTKPFYIYWENCSWSQNYEASADFVSANQLAIQKIIEQSFDTSEGVVVIRVSADENDADASVKFKGKNAIQQAIDSITDASAIKRYQIYVKKGLYKITNSSEFLGRPGYPAMICMKDYVDVVGADADNTILWAELPYDDADIDNSITGEKIARDRHQTVWNYAKEAYMRHLTLVACNLRYTIHQDDPLSKMYNRGYEDVNVIFYGNKGLQRPWGLGSWDGESNNVKGGYTLSANGYAYACHTNTDFNYPTRWIFENHRFITENSNILFFLQASGSLIKNFLELKGCAWGGKGYIVAYEDNWLRGDGNNSDFDHAEWRIIGYGNAPFYLYNAVKGYSLRIASKSTGNTSKVRFDTSSTAYNDLIKNPHINDDASLYIPETNYIDGYITRDGSLGLSGYANGCVDIYEGVYAYDSVNYTSLGHRLGDCSSVNKTLIINIDGTNYTIIFNKDYTGMSNSDILQEINNVISSVAIASIVIYGQEYYPEMPDVTEVVYNNSTTAYIPKGTVLKKVGGRVSPANAGDKIAGVALDDIPVFASNQGVTTGKGRMLKRGYISTDVNQAFYVKVQGSTSVNVGQKLSVNNGNLVIAEDGDVWVKDANIVAINCEE